MTMHDRSTPTVGGALTAPANLRVICAARDAALEQMGRAAEALCAAYDLTADAADTAKAAYGGWHSPRTDRREEATRAHLWRDGFDPADWFFGRRASASWFPNALRTDVLSVLTFGPRSR